MSKGPGSSETLKTKNETHLFVAQALTVCPALCVRLPNTVLGKQVARRVPGGERF